MTSIEFVTILTFLSKNLALRKTYKHNRLDETSIVDRHQCHMAAKFGLFVDEDHSKLPTLYWLPKFINGPINHVLLLILVHVQLLSFLFFSLLGSLRLKNMSLNIAQQFMKEMVKKYFGLLKIPVKFLIN